MIYETLAGIISSGIPQLELTKSLFVNQAPVDSVFCGLFRDGAGGFEIDGYTPTERRGEFVFAMRGKNQAELLDVISQVVTILTIYGLETPNYLIKNCRPLSEPVSYRISAGNYQEISVNFFINYGIVQ